MASRRPLTREELRDGGAARTLAADDVRRRVLTDLPERLVVMSGEADLLHHHLRDCLAALFGGHSDQLEVEPDGMVDDRRRENSEG